MPGQVEEDILARVGASTAQQFDCRTRRNQIVDHDVEVHLLRNPRIGPGRCQVLRSQLKGQPRRGLVVGDHDPVLRPVGDRKPEKLRIELRKAGGVRGVDDDVVHSTEHPPSVALDGRIGQWPEPHPCWNSTRLPNGS